MVTMLNPYHKLSQKNIEDFETRSNIELTDNYKRFLLKWNGGTPDVGVFIISEEVGLSTMNEFYSIGGTYNNIEVYLDILNLRIPRCFIPIGDDPGGNIILLGISGPHYDQIYFWDHENEPDLEEPDMSNMYFLADNIWEFLDNLYEDESDDD